MKKDEPKAKKYTLELLATAGDIGVQQHVCTEEWQIKGKKSNPSVPQMARWVWILILTLWPSQNQNSTQLTERLHIREHLKDRLSEQNQHKVVLL